MDVKQLQISRNMLKIIACLSMIVDHFAIFFIEANTVTYSILRFVIGRIAFPIFCVLMIQGFCFTKNRRKHLIIFFILAILSEPVFDFMLTHSFFDLHYQNVMWLWFIGYFCLTCYDRLRCCYIYSQCGVNDLRLILRKIGSVFLFLFCLFVACFWATCWNVDYGWIGIVCFFFGYLFYTKCENVRLYEIAVVVCIIEAIFTNCVMCVLSVIFVWFYDNYIRFGLTNRLINVDKRFKMIQKLFFYGFYPIHLFVFVLYSILVIGV